jgi:hypothetical protein
MAQSLYIFLDGYSPKPRHRLTNLNSNHANDDAFVKEDERVMTSFEIVRMILDVSFTLAAILKQHLTTNGVESGPLIIASRRSQLMFALDHLPGHYARLPKYLQILLTTESTDTILTTTEEHNHD